MTLVATAREAVFEAPAQQNECAADFADCLTVVLAEIRNGLEVRYQAAGQPDQLDIALALPLEASARLDAIEISVNVDLQLRRRMLGWPTHCEGLNAVEAELGEIQPIHKDIDRPDRGISNKQYQRLAWETPSKGSYWF